MASGIYWIKNTLNNKVYIGSACNLKRRQNEHFARLNKGTHTNRHLQNSWNKYGKDVFIFEILEFVEKPKLIKKEQKYLNKYKSYNKYFGYNINKKAESSLGLKRTKTQIYNSIIARGAKRFYVYTKNKKRVGSFINKKECAIFLGLKSSSNITACLNWKKKTLFNYVFIYKDELYRLDEKISYTIIESSRPFIMYDKFDNIYGIFVNQNECANMFNLDSKNINAVLNNTKKTHKQYYFEYLE